MRISPCQSSLVLLNSDLNIDCLMLPVKSEYAFFQGMKKLSCSLSNYLGLIDSCNFKQLINFFQDPEMKEALVSFKNLQQDNLKFLLICVVASFVSNFLYSSLYEVPLISQIIYLVNLFLPVCLLKPSSINESDQRLFPGE